MPAEYVRQGPQSIRWIKEAVDLTRPVSWRGTVVCNDDCDNCPLYLKGCMGGCTRFDDQVCKNCPCLASVGMLHAKDNGTLNTVDPDTGENAPPEVEVARLAKGIY